MRPELICLERRLRSRKWGARGLSHGIVDLWTYSQLAREQPDGQENSGSKECRVNVQDEP